MKVEIEIGEGEGRVRLIADAQIKTGSEYWCDEQRLAFVGGCISRAIGAFLVARAVIVTDDRTEDEGRPG